MKLEVEIIGLAELRKKIRALGDAFSEMLETAVTAGALPVQNAAKIYCPKRTRHLSTSIHMETMSKSRERVEVAVGTNVIYAAMQEFGGTIVPKLAKTLHFVIHGQEVFAKRVQIPAHPYLRPALDENKDKAIQEIGDVLKILLEKAGQ